MILNDLYLLHPSQAGVEGQEGRINLATRQQWTSNNLSGYPFTVTVSFNKKIEQSNSALGSYISYDRNGPTRQLLGQLTYAHHINLNGMDGYSRHKVILGAVVTR